MKILIVSDTHGYNENMWEAIEREEPFDMMIHCGDIEDDPARIRDKVDCTLHMVAGNNDYNPDLDRVRTFNIGKYKGLVVHGHRYGVYSELDRLYYLGVENQADFVFFGHVHIPIVQQEGPVLLVNPGSLTYPRQQGRKASYAVMTVSDTERPSVEIKYI